MRRINRKDYKYAQNCLKRYTYNQKKIEKIIGEESGLRSPIIDGMPKPKYIKSDATLNSVINMQKNEELIELRKRVKAVDLALTRVNPDCIKIFNEFYISKKNTYDVIDKLNLSDRTFQRRKQELIYAVHEELKKWRKNDE